MTTLNNILNAIGEFFGWRKVADDPETRRRKRIEAIDSELANCRKKRDILLGQKVEDKNEEDHAVESGLVAADIVRLRRERKALER